MVSENRKKQNKEAIWWDFGKTLNALEIRRIFFFKFHILFYRRGGSTLGQKQGAQYAN